MSNKANRKSSKTARRTDASDFVIKKRVEKSWLLTGTTLVAGVLGFGVGLSPLQAFAAPNCTEGSDGLYACHGGTATAPVAVTIDMDTSDFFTVTLYGNGDVDPFRIDVDDANPALTVNANGETGRIDQQTGAYVRNSDGDGLWVYGASSEEGVEINVNDEIIGGADAEDASGSGIRLGDSSEEAGGNYRVNVNYDDSEDGSKGNVRGNQYGIYAAGIGDLEVNNNYQAEITGYNEDGIGIIGAGDVHIDNAGQIQGGSGSFNDWSGGAGISVQDAGSVNIDNHSYQSIVGVGGVYTAGTGRVQINNGNGLILGAGDDGVYITDVLNDESADPAVQINNNHAGFIIGAYSGVHIDGPVAASEEGFSSDIRINNDIYYDDEQQRQAGGLIVGTDGAGVAIHGDASGEEGVIVGNVDINNGGTTEWLPPGSVVLDEVVGGLLGEISEDTGGYIPLGIYGYGDGVEVGNIQGEVNVNNGGRAPAYWNGSEDVPLDSEPWIDGGVIVGFDGNGVDLYDITGRVHVNNGNNNNFGSRGGVIAGYDGNGVEIDGISGETGVNNSGGTIFGWYSGVHIENAGNSEEGVDVYNPDGVIIGWDEIGVDVFAPEARNVSMSNVRWQDDEDASHGGIILGDEQGVRLAGVDLWVGNGPGGAIIGNGFSDLEGTVPAVVDLYSYNSEGTGNANVENFGLISSWGDGEFDTLPHFAWDDPYFFGGNQDGFFDDLGFTLDLDAIRSDTGVFGEFAWTGGQSGALANDGSELYDYQANAQALAISNVNIDYYGEDFGFDPWANTGAALHVNNHADGIMFGRVQSAGYGIEGNSNSIENHGIWYVQDGEDGPAAALFGGEDGFNGIDNAGLIQTAFDFGSEERATFYVGQLFNGGYYSDPDGEGGEDGGMVGSPGLISMIDGGAGDLVEVSTDYQYWSDMGPGFGNHGFHGSYDGALTSFVGMDVDFSGGAENGYSDFLQVYGDIDGSTGIIFNTVASGTEMIGDSIHVVHIAGWDQNGEDQWCFDEACAAGDTMYISDRSANYVDVGGIGTIQDGFYSWYLTEQPTEEMPDPDFYLVSTFSPNTVQLPSLITGAQNIWYETAGVVADHVYGNHFPLEGEGGGGADLMVGEAPAAPAATPNFSVWGKASGSWTQQDDTVTQTVGPVTVDIDTSFVQSTFSLLAGVDYASNPGGDGLRAGVFGGAVGSSLDFDSYSASATYTGGTIGAYGAVTFGGFYADAEAKADFLDMDYSAMGIDASASVTNMGILANAGYRAEMGGFFLEPNGSVAFVSSSIDDISAGGATVSFTNGDSLRAGAGVKVGTTLQTGETTTELAISGKIWNEFEDANEVTVADGMGNEVTFSDDISGAFAELRATATVYADDRSFSAFATAGTKFNEDFTTVDGKVGLRKGF
jgi:hypothetical protein